MTKMTKKQRKMRMLQNENAFCRSCWKSSRMSIGDSRPYFSLFMEKNSRCGVEIGLGNGFENATQVLLF